MFYLKALLVIVIFKNGYFLEYEIDANNYKPTNRKYSQQIISDIISKISIGCRENETEGNSESHYDLACQVRGRYSVVEYKNNTRGNFSAVSHRACPFAPTNILLPPERDIGDKCAPLQRECDPDDIYYSFDGSCNNIQFPMWAETQTPFTRLLKANFSDGFCSPRKSSNGHDLPLARKIRTTILTDKDIPSICFNVLFYGFGQWVDHDVSRMDVVPTVSCCSDGKPIKNEPKDVCLPVIVPNDDAFYSKFNVTCLDLTRAINTHIQNCSISPCSPVNFQTGVLDLSILYGPNDEHVKAIRRFKNGELAWEDDKATGYEIFPPIVHGEELCPGGGLDATPGSSCMHTGDDRVNQNPELTMMEVIFLRCHNLVAAELRKYNPKWNDEITFQETRKVLIALYQHVIFAEHVPLILGIEASSIYKLLPVSKGYANLYDPHLNPQTMVEYGFAAGRSHHSMIRGLVHYLGSHGEHEEYKLRDKFFNQQFLLEKHVFTNLMSSYTKENSNRQDEHFSGEVTDWLLFSAGDPFGSDLPAIDILRGLDSGTPPYNEMRQACGLCRFSSFRDMAGEIMEEGDIEKLEELYDSIEDLDFYVGGLLEKPLKGSTVGPTFTCVIGESFYRWKFGDRLYYEFPQAKFTSAQLNSIRSVSFAYLLCLSNPDLKYVPKNAFSPPSQANSMIRCSEVQAVDFSVFKDRAHRVNK